MTIPLSRMISMTSAEAARRRSLEVSARRRPHAGVPVGVARADSAAGELISARVPPPWPRKRVDRRN